MATNTPFSPQVNVPNIQVPEVSVPNFEVPEITFGQSIDPNSFGAGLGAGVEQTQATFFGAAEAFGESFGFDTLEEWGAQGRERNLQQLERYGQGVAFDEADSFSDWVDYFARKGGEVLPSLLGNVAAVAGGAVVGGPAGAVTAQGLYSLPQRVGTAKIRSEELKPGEELTGQEYGAAIGLSVADSFLAGKLTSPFMKSTIQGSIEKMGKERTKEALEQGLIKAGTAKETARSAAEGAVLAGSLNSVDAAITESVAQSSAGQEVDWDNVYDLMKEAAVLGGAFGGPAGGVGGYVRNKNLKDFIQKDTEYDVESIFKERGVARQLWDKYTGTAMDPLLPKLGKSSTGRKLAATLRNIKGAGVDDLETVRRDINARYSNALYESFNAAKAFYGRGWKTKMIKDYKAGVDNEGTRGIRTTLRELGNESVKRGILSEEQLVQNYLPATIDKQRVLAAWPEFVADLEARGYDTSTPKHKEALVKYKHALETDNWSNFSSQMDRISTGEIERGGKIMQGRVSKPQANVDNSRYFPVGQEFYDKWSVRGNEGATAVNAIDRYVHEVSHRHAAVDVLGANGEKLNQMIAATARELSDVGEYFNPAEVNRVYSVIEAYDNVFNRIENPVFRNFTSVIRTLGTVSSLPLVVLSSLTEPLNIAIKTDMATTFSATGTVMARAGKDIARRAFLQRPGDGYNSRKAQASMGGQSLAQIDSVVMSRLTDPTVGNLSAAINKGFFRAVGLTWWTQAVRNMSSEAARIQIRNDLKLIKNSAFRNTGATQRANQRLAELGMSTDDIAYLNANGPKSEQTVNEIYARAINRFNRDVVLEPSFADRPLWMSAQNMWFIAQLQGYPTMFTNTVLPQLGKKLTGTPSEVLDALFIVGAVGLIGSAQLTARDIVAGREVERDPEELLLEALTRFLSAKPVNTAVGLFKADEFGVSPVETLMGPIGGLLNDTVVNIEDLVTGETDIGEAVWSIARDTTPARSFRNWMDE